MARDTAWLERPTGAIVLAQVDGDVEDLPPLGHHLVSAARLAHVRELPSQQLDLLLADRVERELAEDGLEVVDPHRLVGTLRRVGLLTEVDGEVVMPEVIQRRHLRLSLSFDRFFHDHTFS